MAGGLFSTKGRYALRAMGDLAMHEGWISLGDVAERQGISRKYAEGSLAPVACLDCTVGELCPRVEDCPTVTIWRDLGKLTSSFLDSKTLADILVDEDFCKEQEC